MIEMKWDGFIIVMSILIVTNLCGLGMIALGIAKMCDVLESWIKWCKQEDQVEVPDDFK